MQRVPDLMQLAIGTNICSWTGRSSGMQNRSEEQINNDARGIFKSQDTERSLFIHMTNIYWTSTVCWALSYEVSNINIQRYNPVGKSEILEKSSCFHGQQRWERENGTFCDPRELQKANWWWGWVVWRDKAPWTRSQRTLSDIFKSLV